MIIKKKKKKKNSKWKKTNGIYGWRVKTNYIYMDEELTKDWIKEIWNLEVWIDKMQT